MAAGERSYELTMAEYTYGKSLPGLPQDTIIVVIILFDFCRHAIGWINDGFSLQLQPARIFSSTVISFAFLLTISQYYVRKRIESIYPKYRSVTGMVTVTWDDAGLSYVDKHVQCKFTWIHFKYVYENKLIAKLVLRHEFEFTLPKRAFSAPDIAEIRGHIRAAGGKA